MGIKLSKKSLLYIVTLFLVGLFLFITITVNYKEKIDLYLENETKLFNTQYITIYNNLKKLANISFYGMVYKDEIMNAFSKAYKSNDEEKKVIRKTLYDRLIRDYNLMTDFNFHQLHFHLPNNHSFLRMHKPDKYGDDLSGVRYSIKYVNEKLIPVDGFEMGRIVQGYRFVYPLLDKELNHVGSVETSISTEYFKNEFAKNFNAHVHFLIKKEIVDKKIFKEFRKSYHKSLENDDYLLYLKDKTSFYDSKDDMNKEAYTKRFVEKIKKNMNNNQAFSLYKKVDEKHKVISFIPVKNIEDKAVVAYLIAYQNSSYIKSLEINLYAQLFVAFIVMLILIFFVILLNKEENKNKSKDLMLAQQSKMAAMGEMLGNIAHQWRQPLSAISTIASGVRFQKDLGVLKDDFLEDSMVSIVKNTKYLSQTIDDFRDFFKDEKEVNEFNIKKTFEDINFIFSQSFINSDIKLLLSCDDIFITSNENELKQALVNIIKNAKDAIQNDGIIKVNLKKDKEGVKIEIFDSGGGIESKNINNIFEPYFTTKHQSQGTGIGLYMTYQIITDHLKGSIKVENSSFDYNFKLFKGAKFTITLPNLESEVSDY